MAARRSPSSKKKRPRPERRRASARTKNVTLAARKLTELAPARKAAITRARQRLAELPSARTPAQARQVEQRREELAATLRRAGYSEASVRSQLGWITREREERERQKKLEADRRRRRERERARKKQREEAQKKEAAAVAAAAARAKVEKRKKGKKPSPAQLAAVTRAAGRLEELPTYTRTLAHKELEKIRRRQLVETMRRAGYSESEIRTRLRQIARRRRAREQTLAEVQAEVLGVRKPLQGRYRENWYVLRNHITYNTPEFRRYIERAEQLGASYEEAVDRWFSPGAQ